jgi:hypothetical protein
MRLHLVLLALALGCATEDSKTDDTSSNGSGDEGEDMGNLLSQVAEMATEMAEMSAKIAAQQATIAQLEMQMSQTLRWETVEHTCSAEAAVEAVGLSSVGAVTATAFYREAGWTHGAWYLSESSPYLEEDDVEVGCFGFGDDHKKYWLVTVGYER